MGRLCIMRSMATLRAPDGSLRPLPSRLLVGRSSSCSLHLPDKRVSGEHATLAWNGQHWTVRDLASRNGTYVDGERLESGSSKALKPGSLLSFGGPDDGFTLVGGGAPSAFVSAGEELLFAVDGLLALPDSDTPELVVYPDGRGGWGGEHNGETFDVADGMTLEVAGRSWTLHIPATLDGTATVDAGPTLDTIRLELAVSMDEEHVEIRVHHRGQKTILEAREHSYILLTLARARQDDAALPLKEQGWLDRDQLLKMLGTDTNALNVGIYRARGQLAASGVDGAAGIVEVRRGRRRFGLEPDRFSITAL